MTPYERASMRADVIAGLCGVLVFLLIWWLAPDRGPTLVNNPCAPHYQVFVDGEWVDCTGGKFPQGRD